MHAICDVGGSGSGMLNILTVNEADEAGRKRQVPQGDDHLKRETYRSHALFALHQGQHFRIVACELQLVKGS